MMLRIRSIPSWNLEGVGAALFPMVNILYTRLNAKIIINVFNIPDAMVERLAKSWNVANNHTINNAAKMIPNIITRIRFIPSDLMLEKSFMVDGIDETNSSFSFVNNFIPKNIAHPDKSIKSNIIIKI